ncbi:hypothetical protein N7493_007300 [Penicillium malachiteum]|uniref:Uncharacterized protein n=1 Tax=Penicillium malachiteum TaxID=1324776 RepID=A0AAD6HIY6_9EURO|nr:hypothetical protein N7493_007300 [Penicillium malachiteum]
MLFNRALTREGEAFLQQETSQSEMTLRGMEAKEEAKEESTEEPKEQLDWSSAVNYLQIVTTTTSSIQI